MTHRFHASILACLLCGCASQNAAITDSGSEVQIRQIQTRDYDTLNKRDTLRSILATLQDLGIVIDKADYDLATVIATRCRIIRFA